MRWPWGKPKRWIAEARLHVKDTTLGPWYFVEALVPGVGWTKVYASWKWGEAKNYLAQIRRTGTLS